MTKEIADLEVGHTGWESISKGILPPKLGKELSDEERYVGLAMGGSAPRVLEASPAPSVDLVNHPPHYISHPSGVECITVTEHFNFNVGNAIKYLWRSGLKGDPVEQLEKARWYISREILRLRQGEKAPK